MDSTTPKFLVQAFREEYFQQGLIGNVPLVHERSVAFKFGNLCRRAVCQ